MADVSGYNITVSTVFTAHNVEFMPGHKYWVTEDIYNGKLSDTDSRNFHDLCATAQPQKGVGPQGQ
jgi:hypothetical protein